MGNVVWQVCLLRLFCGHEVTLSELLYFYPSFMICLEFERFSTELVLYSHAVNAFYDPLGYH